MKTSKELFIEEREIDLLDEKSKEPNHKSFNLKPKKKIVKKVYTK